MLVAENLYKVYEDGKINLEVLKDINLEVNKAEILCIIGGPREPANPRCFMHSAA